MSLNDELQEALRKVEELKRKMSYCKHEFQEAISDPETIRVADDRNGYEVHGVDRWPRLSFHDEQKPRWSRQCKVCGFKQYTYVQETVEVVKKPKFT